MSAGYHASHDRRWSGVLRSCFDRCGTRADPSDHTRVRQSCRELLEWRRPNGGLKSRECCLFLRDLHRRGWLPWLTAPQSKTPRTPLAKLVPEPVPAPILLGGSLDHSSGRFVIYQRRLAQSAPGGQSQSIPDSPLGPHPPPRHHILALTARQLPCDWQTHYGITPVLLETLVDPAHYPGICYRAANWTPSA